MSHPALNHYPAHVRKDVPIPDWSLPQMLAETVRQYPDHEAISFYGVTMTYSALQGAVRAFAASLQRRGLQRGERVAIMLPNCPQYVIAYYGILTAGGIVTQVNPMSVERELEHLFRDSGSTYAVVLDALYPRLKAVQARTAVKEVIVVALEPTQAAFHPDVMFDSFLAEGFAAPLAPVVIDPAQDVAILQYTGGTTGRSKGAMLTHKNLVANVVQSAEFFQDVLKPAQERCLSALPLFHVFGMTSCMNLTLYMGSTLILLPRFQPAEVLATIERERATTFPGVPTMYVALTHHQDISPEKLASLNTCNSGGAPMPLELMNQFEQKTGATVLEGYGLSESSPVTHCNPSFGVRKPGSIGLPFPSTEFKVVDVETGTQEVPTGELGELIVRGPQVMKGYWNMPEETAQVLRDGWLYTGDIARVDEDGYAYIVDRKKDLIIASGYNIYPRDIEEVLYEHPDVIEAVVIGVADDYRGETVKAFVVPKPGATITVEQLEAYCRKNLAPYKVPKYFEFRSELPKSAVGKILRRQLREEGSAPSA
ncbi:long-chain fatty acid--CoA ligase [Alicyclobacillus fastidiosus]|uniref:Long-chain fatty acid--CoA ligase n=1 Tax=Alicyclobacillus fastidiosus TaxID=392011 RepID=A0ABY6ZFX8_9BACL|nr:long-chain fatty acid--CoA ligase [Alicyclobacillus fastidiosus]WAH41015.1 long-chain fatty acid--CoA ligase [Alicyclobacillus fastidiosus]